MPVDKAAGPSGGGHATQKLVRKRQIVHARKPDCERSPRGLLSVASTAPSRSRGPRNHQWQPQE
jgi:hypothetical protein